MVFKEKMGKMGFILKEQKKFTKEKIVLFIKSIWFFPAILTICLIVLCALNINGSSMGVYNDLFFGNNSSKNDQNLIFGQYKSIRSDEWIMNTQKVISQKNNNYQSINTNIGNGEDETLIIDAPTRDWSVIFKPHDLGFFVMPFETAFSLRWWLMAYFLVISCYLFVLLLLPGKKLLASIISLAFLFSPFLQWWYQYATLGPIYYALFGIVVFANLIKAKNKYIAMSLGLLLSYIAVCFALVLYPPFQIPCGLVLVFFSIGYLLNNLKIINKKTLKRNLIILAVSIIIALGTVGVFVAQHASTVNTIQNTAYPGKRIAKSGGYSVEHLLASNLSPLFQDSKRAPFYQKTEINAVNQSESSNFILIIPFIIIPLLFLSFKKYKKNRQVDYIILSTIALTVIILAWLFIPGLDLLGKITLLDKVPTQRLLIGLGLLNLISLTLFIKEYSESRQKIDFNISIIIALCVFILYLIIDFHTMKNFPEFIGFKYSILLAIPISLIIFFLSRKGFVMSCLILLIFSFLSTFHINPLYQGTSILENNLISQAIKEIGKTSDKKWVSEDIILENFATMNGEPSLTGVYVYPQKDVWNSIAKQNESYIYNRYAHVNFNFIRNNNLEAPYLTLVSSDQFRVSIKPCDKFLKNQNVGFLMTSNPLSKDEAPCATKIKSITFPTATFTIYSLNF